MDKQISLDVNVLVIARLREAISATFGNAIRSVNTSLRGAKQSHLNRDCFAEPRNDASPSQTPKGALNSTTQSPFRGLGRKQSPTTNVLYYNV